MSKTLVIVIREDSLQDALQLAADRHASPASTAEILKPHAAVWAQADETGVAVDKSRKTPHASSVVTVDAIGGIVADNLR